SLSFLPMCEHKLIDRQLSLSCHIYTHCMRPHTNKPSSHAEHTFCTVSWMREFGKLMFSPRSREEVIWRRRREQEADRDEL
uniref:Uncharacterized protein n=1 Tax=Amphilophus citrinellus TaxID=61819 RepID=A0A3Q0RIC6_AMPCI